MTPEQLQQLGITLYRYPTPAGQPRRVFYGDNGSVSGQRGMGEITDPEALGVDISSLQDVTRIPEGTYGGTSKSNFSGNQFSTFATGLVQSQKNAKIMEDERNAVLKFNEFVDKYRGTNQSVDIPPEIDPSQEYTIFNGALVKKANLPALQGTTTDSGGNIVGAPAVAPAGSAADVLKQQIASGAVSPTNVDQQVAASATGNNTSAPGITPQVPNAPVAPTQPAPTVDPILAAFNQQAVQGTVPSQPAAPASAPSPVVDPVLAAFNQQAVQGTLPSQPAQPAPSSVPSPTVDPVLAAFNQQAVNGTLPQTVSQVVPAQTVNPAQVNIGTAEAPLMVPAGSAGANLAQGIQSGAVSPTNPNQQVAVSNTGNNTTEPGIVPSNPNPPIAQPLAPAENGQIPVQVGSGTAYIPEGSAAAQLAQGISNGSVSPTNPDQQYGASLAGNNVNAPGINPQAPSTPSLTPTPTPQDQTQPGANSGAQGAATGQFDATTGANPTQVGGKFGTQNFGRIGNDVYEIMSDGSYRPVSEAEFLNNWKAKGLNLDVLPQLSPAQTTSTPTGPTVPTTNTDGTPKTPSNFISDYAGIVRELGLTSIKQTIEDMNKSYQELQDKKVSEIGDVNMNPWLSEGLRSKKIANINSQYESREANLTARLKLQNALYDEGLAQAKFLTSGLQEDRNKLLDLAVKREEAQAKVAQYDFENQLKLSNLTLDEKQFALNEYKATHDTTTPTEGDKQTYEANVIQSRLLASKSGGQYVDGNVYLSEKARSRMSPSEFDGRFGLLLSPSDRTKYGIGKSTSSGSGSTSSGLDFSNL